VQLTAEAELVGGVVRLLLSVQLVGGLEEGALLGSPLALEAVAQRVERAVAIPHPVAQIIEHLRGRLCTVQRLYPGPLFGLRLPDKVDHLLREKRPPTIIAAGQLRVAVAEHVRLCHALEGGLVMAEELIDQAICHPFASRSA
jgi:hypothetical protein